MAHLTSIANYWFSAYEISSNMWFSLIYKKTLQIFYLENPLCRLPLYWIMKILTDFWVVCYSLCLNTLTTGGAVDVKAMKRVLRMTLLPAASCVLHTAHICIPNTDYVPLMCYMFIPVTTVYAGFPLHPLSISAHHAGGGGWEHYVLLRWNMFCEDSRVCVRKQMPSSLADGAFACSACLRKYMSGAACARGMVKALRS